MRIKKRNFCVLRHCELPVLDSFFEGVAGDCQAKWHFLLSGRVVVYSHLLLLLIDFNKLVYRREFLERLLCCGESALRGSSLLQAVLGENAQFTSVNGFFRAILTPYCFSGVKFQ